MYLTQRQSDILDFIQRFQAERGISPTHREICEEFGYSSYGTVYKHLKLLEEKGYIYKPWNQKRGIVVIDRDRREVMTCAQDLLAALDEYDELPAEVSASIRKMRRALADAEGVTA